MVVSVVLLRSVLAELRWRGLDEMRVLEGTNVSQRTLEDHAAVISPADWDVIIERALALSDDPELALSIARHLRLGLLSVVGHLVRASATLRDAAAVLTRYGELLDGQIAWKLLEGEGGAQLICQPVLARGLATRFRVELALGVALAAVRQQSPSRICPVVLELSYPLPPNPGGYEHQLGCRVRFAQPNCALTFAPALLDEPRFGLQDALITLRLRDQAERLLAARASRGTLERARALLEQSQDPQRFQPEWLAAALGLSVRAMRRRLAAEGTSFEELRGQVRFALARDAMRSPAILKGLSEQLGFSEPSAFYRAFKRWTGMTTSEYLRRQGEEPPLASESPRHGQSVRS